MSGGELRLGVIGARGRLGRNVVDAADERGIPVVMRADTSGWREVAPPTVVVDAGAGDSVALSAEYCRRHDAALVHCTSDLDQHGEAVLRRLAVELPVVRAVNLSIGHWLQRRLVAQLAVMTAGLDGVHVSVLDRHTRSKRDRPSASARALTHAWNEAAGGSVDELVSYRSGGPVSEHRLDVTLDDESVTVLHDVSSLRSAARGAVLAAAWAVAAQAGYHAFDDVLSLHLTSGETAHV